MRTIPLRYLVGLNESTLPDNTPPDFAFKYVDISQVDSSGSVALPEDFTLFGEAPSRARRVAMSGDTIVSTVRTYLRAIARVPAVIEPVVYSTGFAVLRPTAIDSRFLSYACLSSRFIDEVVARSTGVSYPAINASDLLNIAVPVPREDEQRRIADFLDDRVARIDQIIAARESLLALWRYQYQAWLGRKFDALGEECGWMPLRRSLVSVDQGWSPESQALPAEGSQPGVLKLGAVKNGEFLPTENKAFLDGTSPKPAHRISSGDLLMTRANTPALVGDVAVVTDVGDTPVFLSDLIYRLTVKGADVHFVSAALRTPRTRQDIATLARGTSASMTKLRGEDIAVMMLPRASLNAQQTLGRQDCEQRSGLKRVTTLLRSSIVLLNEYKQSLITAAVTGELDVTTASRKIPGE